MLGHTKRVLMIGAHPDDEDTELLTYLVRHEGAEAAYLSLTRGEGGQNLLGSELGEALGLLRSEELLAARGLDGARQYFTRAFDFGYSKTMNEAFRFWPRDSVLKDVVRIVRRFRPQIIVAIFSGTPRDGHGQHQVAGWVAREAFRVAADPGRFRELAREEGLPPWRPDKLFRSARWDTAGATLVLQGGVLDAEIGQSYRQIAMRGRSLHRSQDMGMLQEMGPSPIRLALEQDRSGGGQGLFSGIDTTPPAPRERGIEAADQDRHRGRVAAIRAGLVVDATTEAEPLVPGEAGELELSTWNSGSEAVLATVSLEGPADWTFSSDCLDRERTVLPDSLYRCTVRVHVPRSAEISNPYFLRLERDGALYRWAGDPAHWGEPFEPPRLTARFTLGRAGRAPIVLARPVDHRFRDQAIGEVRRPLIVAPRIDVTIAPRVKVWAANRSQAEPVTVTLLHRAPGVTAGTIHLDLPPGWAEVAPQPFRLTRPDERQTLVFPVRVGPVVDEPGSIRAFARDSAGARYDAGVRTVAYPHIRARSYVQLSHMRVAVAPLALSAGARIGYVRGASDRVPEALASVGIAVDVLDAAELARGELDRYTAIVVGSRAYETDPALVESNGRLLEYVRGGGHLVVQYQQHAFFRRGFAPLPMSVNANHDRVTDEAAPVRLLVPDHPVFQSPNPIAAEDWDGWVQERGLYFPRTWDPGYRPLLETHDPGGAPLAGGILVARVGKGTYVYTGLSFFRQLPAGVPGAYRLFLNLLDPGSRASTP